MRLSTLLGATAATALMLAGGTTVAGLAVGAQTGSAGWWKPVAGARVTQAFGCTSLAIEPWSPTCPSHHFHAGIDLAAAWGTPVHAALAGTAEVVLSPTGYGLHILVDSGAGLLILYGHLSGVSVTSGEAVAGGTVIGEVGSSGNSTGPHLHFEVRRDGIPEDPRNDLSLP